MAQKAGMVIILMAHDRVNVRGLYMKADGKRFGSSQTLKVCCDVKYDLTVTIKPPLQKLEKLVIGGEPVAVESCKERDGTTDYEFSWLTSGFQPTKSGRRSDVNFIFQFENAEVVHAFQVKFYSPDRGAHITWGTESSLSGESGNLSSAKTQFGVSIACTVGGVIFAFAGFVTIIIIIIAAVANS